jgi:hypothetical protein
VGFVTGQTDGQLAGWDAKKKPSLILGMRCWDVWIGGQEVAGRDGMGWESERGGVQQGDF